MSKVLNNEDRKKKMYAIETLRTGVSYNGMTEASAEKFLKDLGVDPEGEAVLGLEKSKAKKAKKKEKKEEPKKEEKKEKVEEAQMTPTSPDSFTGEKGAECGKPCPCEKKNKCKKHKKQELKEEEVKDKINSVESASSMLKAKNINYDKTEKVGNRTVFKQGNTIVGAWDPAWGTVRTGEDLLK